MTKRLVILNAKRERIRLPFKSDLFAEHNFNRGKIVVCILLCRI